MMDFRKILLLLAICIYVVACSSDKPSKPGNQQPVKKEQKAEKVTSAEETTTEEAPATQPVPPEQLAKAKEVIAGVSDDAVAGVDAKKKYKMFCAACHGFTGDLNVNGAKDLTMSKIGLEESVAQVYHGKGLMTPFKGILKDEEIVAVAKYIETLRN